ncbi:SDR family oxidoreductase [Kribbella qitaiheensis]|uniref:SDR family oxidoreductase n=1 Tax=Kribbella qitaiheensis TaxID=1544730 RepID=UPI00361A71EE
MKIVVIGGSGLIGSYLVSKLGEHGHEAVPASPNTGVNTLTGEGLAEVLTGASVLIDVSNSPSFETKAVMEFFETSTRNLLAAEAEAGVGHHVALSVVGTGRLPDSGYLEAKAAQEALIAKSSMPYSIVEATQFYEFVGRIADSATEDGVIKVPDALIQPMAAEDVAAAVGRTAVGSPLNGKTEIGGPEEFRFSDLIQQHLALSNDPRKVMVDPHGTYFGTELEERSLVPGEGATLSETTYTEWLKSH